MAAVDARFAQGCLDTLKFRRLEAVSPNSPLKQRQIGDEAGCNGNEEDLACTSVGEVIFQADDLDNWNLSTEEENHEVDEEEEEAEMDEELATFLRQTAEHRKQRDAERLEKENKKGGFWMEINGEDYILADKS
ncbi:unnamed protein product [Toxocara canis]|uniref:Uncharacterized protein n=1 Tax=Toxocara canis TaxID=6265 RepID=A0A183U6X9_TOXCA|nr:unnamed protein product [Toxocara canis]